MDIFIEYLKVFITGGLITGLSSSSNFITLTKLGGISLVIIAEWVAIIENESNSTKIFFRSFIKSISKFGCNAVSGSSIKNTLALSELKINS